MRRGLTTHTLQLADGRLLGYARYGCEGGRPVLYFHGMLGSRFECALLHRAGHDLQLCIYALERPGYGLSTPQSDRRMKLWADDVEAFADALGLSRFALVGVSGGGPYVLACASLLQERLIGAAVSGGLGPLSVDAVRDEMSGMVRLGLKITGGNGTMLSKIYGPPLARLARLSPRLALRTFALPLSDEDKKVLRSQIVEEIFSRNLREAFRQGIDGALRDMELYRMDWLFSVEDIKVPVHLWHGTADRIVPPAHSEGLAAAISAAQLHLVPNEGHFSLPVKHAAGILGSALDDAS